MEKIKAGERLEGIEEDPILSKECEYEYEYNMIPGYLKREESSVVGEHKIKL